MWRDTSSGAALLPLPAPASGWLTRWAGGFAHHPFITGSYVNPPAQPSEGASMDNAYLLCRVNNLQHELLQISEHYREYFTKENHSAYERAQHEEQVERVNEIREELLARWKRQRHKVKTPRVLLSTRGLCLFP
jgi:hypothetical protein